MKKEIYIVEAERFTLTHSYIVAAFSKKAQAIKCAESHTDYRGGKYFCVVRMFKVDEFDNKFDNYSKEIYRTKI